MALHTNRPVSIGVRELHNRTSELMQRVVNEDLPLVITLRGKPVARIVPIDENDPVERLRREGLIHEPAVSGKWHPDPIKPASGATVSDLISEQRR